MSPKFISGHRLHGTCLYGWDDFISDGWDTARIREASPQIHAVLGVPAHFGWARCFYPVHVNDYTLPRCIPFTDMGLAPILATASGQTGSCVEPLRSSLSLQMNTEL